MDFSQMKASDVKSYLKQISLNERVTHMDSLREDTRKSVQKLADQIEKEQKKFEAELQRLEGLWAYERAAKATGHRVIAGIDEAGRGPLAGPVVAACVVLPEDHGLLGLDDSKKIPEARREQLFEQIHERALAVGIGLADHSEIDQINILNATKKAMKRAIADTGAELDYLLIDAVELKDVPVRQEPLIKGDSKSASIAAASIIAKVTRDRLIAEYAEAYPGYELEKNKGYGTPAHYEGLRQQGPCPIHRLSFLKRFLEV